MNPPAILKWGLLGFIVSGCAGPSGLYSPPRKMVVAVPVANVRSERIPHSGTYEYDSKQETQVELGEPILVFEKVDGWFRIEAPEQQEFTHNSRWQGYPGWVKATALTNKLEFHHHLTRSTAPLSSVRSNVLANASLHLGNPYLWGGRSLTDSKVQNVATGVDCSGLVNWSFRQEGWFVPRDAHEQYMKSRSVSPDKIKPADLIFLAKPENPEKIVHVAFFKGDGMILEAPSSGEKVREISISDRFGAPLSALKPGKEYNGRIIHFGSLFPED